MMESNESKRVLIIFVSLFVMASAACSSGVGTVEARAASLESEPAVAFAADGEVLTHGTTYRTSTDVPFRFSVPNNGGVWRGVVEHEWSVSLIFVNESVSAGDDAEPGVSLAVAEEGATPESVAESIMASRREFDYQRSEGVFEGREVIILEGAHSHPGVGNPVKVETGEQSYFFVLIEGDRTYRSQIFEEEGRVFVVSSDAFSGDEALALAEFAPVFESLEIGAGG